ncbi:MAG: hypothetical protein QOE70_4031 [Chthoniobacter sp.]|nr:hypothetical protein [Chthoniobacter sp.]
MFISRNDDDEGVTPVLSHGGVPALALARVVGGKDRAKGCSDAEILIDRDRYNDCHPAQQDALLDHELQHFELATDKFGAPTHDAGYRPKLKLRPHDYDFGWFECVARRHGMASFEVQQAKVMMDESGEVLFPFMHSMESSPVPLPISTPLQAAPEVVAVPEPVAETPETGDLPEAKPAETPVEAAATTMVKWSFFFGQPSRRKLAPEKAAEIGAVVQPGI